MELYGDAVSVAIRQATQQDGFAVGKSVQTYLESRPVDIVSYTVVALACAMAVPLFIVLYEEMKK